MTYLLGVSLFKKIQSISNMEEVFVALHADNEDVRSVSVIGISVLPLSLPAALFRTPKYARSNEISRLRCPHILLGKRSALLMC